VRVHGVGAPRRRRVGKFRRGTPEEEGRCGGVVLRGGGFVDEGGGRANGYARGGPEDIFGRLGGRVSRGGIGYRGKAAGRNWPEVGDEEGPQWPWD